MSYTFDFFVGRLACPACGHTSEPDHHTGIQTYVRDDPQAAMLGAGDPLVLPDDMEDRHYIALRSPQHDEAIHIGEAWSCPSCQSFPLWAEVIVADSLIRSIASVDLQEALDRLHYIKFDIVDVLQARTGATYDEILDGDLPAMVRAMPPA